MVRVYFNAFFHLFQIFPSVMRALRSKGAQLALCAELSQMVKLHKSQLEHGQFDLVVRLLNTSLQVC